MNAPRRLLTLSLGTLATAMLSLGAPSSLAGTATGTLSVDAQVTNTCTIGSAALHFGTFSSASSTAKSATAMTTVNCTLLAPYTLAMDQGQNASGTSNRMKATVGSTDYFLPYSASFTVTTVVNGVSTVHSGVSLPLVGTGTDLPVTINGTATAGVNVPAATYNDSVTMTVSF